MDPNVDARLLDRLRRTGLEGFLTTVRSLRVKSYLTRPMLLIHDGWRLAQGCDLGRDKPRTYLLGEIARCGQMLVLDRKAGTLRLTTFDRSERHTLELDLASNRVLRNFWDSRELVG